eukprot:jgi/Botrbrau1/9407/Bobra.0252s0032.1
MNSQTERFQQRYGATFLFLCAAQPPHSTAFSHSNNGSWSSAINSPQVRLLALSHMLKQTMATPMMQLYCNITTAFTRSKTRPESSASHTHAWRQMCYHVAPAFPRRCHVAPWPLTSVPQRCQSCPSLTSDSNHQISSLAPSPRLLRKDQILNFKGVRVGSHVHVCRATPPPPPIPPFPRAYTHVHHKLCRTCSEVQPCSVSYGLKGNALKPSPPPPLGEHPFCSLDQDLVNPSNTHAIPCMHSTSALPSS